MAELETECFHLIRDVNVKSVAIIFFIHSDIFLLKATKQNDWKKWVWALFLTNNYSLKWDKAEHLIALEYQGSATKWKFTDPQEGKGLIQQ